MASTITGIGSGFDIDGWVSSLVSAKQESTVKPLTTKLSALNTKNSAITGLKSKCSKLLSTLQTFTKSMYNSTSDMWTNTSITSSNSDYATAVSKGNVAAASVELKIDQVATATTATSTHSLGAFTEEEIENTKFTNLANGQAKAGDFSIFLNGKEYNVEIGEDDTVSDVLNKISETTGNKVQADVDENGYFSIKAYKQDENEQWVEDESANLSIGSSGDSSNFVSALKLHDSIGTYGYKSSYSVSSVLTDVAMVSEESGLKGINFFNEEGEEAESGKITINGVDFTVDKNTSLNDLVSRINGNGDANVKASFDSLTNKLVLTSTETGKNNISLSEEGTNLLNVLGLTEINEEGDEIIASGSQQLGENAIVYINGNKVISNSNTITGESSGIANLSITVKKPTAREDEVIGEDSEKATSVTLDIKPDYSNIETALNDFVTAYNDVINSIKTATSSEGAIGSDATLRGISSTLKGILSNSGENDGVFSLLSQIGISTSKNDISNISIDNEKLKEALSENLYSVKQLLSDGYTSKTDNGIFDRMANVLSGVMDNEKGFFTTYTNSLNNQISNMNKRIETANTRLTRYQSEMAAKFNKMDSVMASLSSQLSLFNAYI